MTTDPAKLAAEIDAVNEVPASSATGSTGSADGDATGTEQTDSTSDERKSRPLGTNYNVAPTSTILTVCLLYTSPSPRDRG